jgi:NitT/TauT family transport system substrate-binding protein
MIACAAALLLAASGLAPARADEPVPIRAGWVIVPSSLLPIMTDAPGVATHDGVTYKLETIHFGAGPAMITALATGELDIANLGFSTIAIAVENAGLSDLRVVFDEVENGRGDYFTGGHYVLNDSPIKTIADLKGKIVAANGIGSGADIILRAALLKHDLVDKRDYTDVEVPFPNMKAMLLSRKIDLGTFTAPFIYDPELNRVAHMLFSQNEAFGTTEMSFYAAHAGFLAKHRQAMVDFLADYIRTVRWYMDPANHEAAVAIVSKFTKVPAATLDPWLFTKKDYYRDPDGKPDLAALQRNVDAQVKLGLVKTDLTVANYADLSLVEDAAKRVK